MQQYRNNRNNGNIYDLRKDLQHTPPPSQQKGSSGSADGRYGFNGEPLSFAPDRTANGTGRRTRTDNSIEFPSQPRRTEQSGTRRTSGQNRNRTAQRSRTAQPEQRASGTARKPQQRRSQGQKPRKTAAQAAQQRYKTQRLRPAQQQPRDPVQREKRKKRRLTRAALKRRRVLGGGGGGGGGEPVFPNWKGLDDTLAMNHMYTFVGYAGQGTLCVEPEAGVTGFNLFVNNRQINTAVMAACGTWIFPARPSTAATPFRWAASVPAAKR